MRAPLTLLFVAILLAPATAASALQAGAASQIDARGIDLFDKGQAAHKAGRFDEAIRLYDESIAHDPEFWGSHYQRGVALLQLDRPAEAEPSLRRAVELEEEMAAAHVALGDALLRLGRDADAEKELTRALAIDPALVAARLNYAVALRKRKAFANAERELARIEADGKATADSRYLLGDVLASLGRAEAAIAVFGRALELDPRHVPSLHARGDLRAKAGDHAGAIEDLTALYRIEPRPEIAAALADLQVRLKGSDGTGLIETFRGRATANPRDMEARRALADALARAGRVDEAKAELATFVAGSPKAPATFDAAGDVLLEAAPLDAARYYVEAVRIDPANVEYRLKLGSALVRSGKYANAVEHLEAAAAKAPERREAHAGLAASYYGLNRYEEAAREFGWLAERDPSSPGIQFFLGASLDRIGDCEGALAAFRRFLSSADPAADKTRIEDVSLRVPAIERQIDRGDCKKKKKGERT
jgi:protein O-GlcNAc transferase